MGNYVRYLMSSTVMSASGSLACSKMLFPESEQSQLKRVSDLKLPKGSVIVGETTQRVNCDLQTILLAPQFTRHVVCQSHSSHAVLFVRATVHTSYSFPRLKFSLLFHRSFLTINCLPPYNFPAFDPLNTENHLVWSSNELNSLPPA